MESADIEISQKSLSAIILAAGLSRRMGSENKLLLNYNNSSLIKETISQVSKSTGIHEIIVVLGHEAELLSDHIAQENIKTVYNEKYKLGQTTSIQAGVSKADNKSQGFMICLGDMPFIRTDEYNTLIEFWNKSETDSIVRPYINEKPGHPVIFDASYRSDILEENYMEGCRTVIKKNSAKLIRFISDNRNYLIDIDKPSDKSKLKA